MYSQVTDSRWASPIQPQPKQIFMTNFFSVSHSIRVKTVGNLPMSTLFLFRRTRDRHSARFDVQQITSTLAVASGIPILGSLAQRHIVLKCLDIQYFGTQWSHLAKKMHIVWSRNSLMTSSHCDEHLRSRNTCFYGSDERPCPVISRKCPMKEDTAKCIWLASSPKKVRSTYAQ